MLIRGTKQSHEQTPATAVAGPAEETLGFLVLKDCAWGEESGKRKQPLYQDDPTKLARVMILEENTKKSTPV